MGEIIRFPRHRTNWTAIHLRLWNASLDRLTDYLRKLKTGENDMSDIKFDYPKDAPLMITTRTFDAPRALVWACFSQPEHVVRWWGPKSISPITKLDKFEFRVGGKWRFVLKSPQGFEMGSGGVYREITKPERIVNTELYDMDWTGGETLATVAFAERGGKTTVTTTVLHATKEARDGAAATPMAEGMETSFKRLDELLVAQAAA